MGDQNLGLLFGPIRGAIASGEVGAAEEMTARHQHVMDVDLDIAYRRVTFL